MQKSSQQQSLLTTKSRAEVRGHCTFDTWRFNSLTFQRTIIKILKKKEVEDQLRKSSQVSFQLVHF